MTPGFSAPPRSVCKPSSELYIILSTLKRFLYRASSSHMTGFLTLLFPYKFLGWQGLGKLYYAFMSYRVLKGTTNQCALISHASFSRISWSHQKERNCYKTWAIVNSYRIKNVRFTLPIIKSPGHMSWCLPQPFLCPKMEKSSQSWNPFYFFSKASTLAPSQVSETHKNAWRFFQLVSEVSGAGDH